MRESAAKRWRPNLVWLGIGGVLRSLIISGACIFLVLFLFFFPNFYYSSFSRAGQSSGFSVGVHYNYEQDQLGQINGEVSRIRSLGFKTIRVTLNCDPTNPDAYINSQTDELFSAVRKFNLSVALATLNHEDLSAVRYYLQRWGKGLSFIQILNEPELSQSWDMGTLFTDDEIVSNFEQLLSVVQQSGVSARLYTNFEPGFVLRTSVPIELGKSLDFVGLDIYMEGFLMLSPHFVDLLNRLTGKEVIVTEFGMSTSNDTAQSQFLIQGLTLFKNMGLKSCWIAYWNSDQYFYGIRGRLAEQSVGEWIAKNSG